MTSPCMLATTMSVLRSASSFARSPSSRASAKPCSASALPAFEVALHRLRRRTATAARAAASHGRPPSRRTPCRRARRSDTPASRPCAAPGSCAARPRRRARASLASMSASCSSCFDVGGLLGAPGLQVQRLFAHAQQPPAQRRRRRGDRWLARPAAQRLGHMGEHRVVPEALSRMLGRAGVELGRIGAVAGALVVLGGGAEEVARAQAGAGSASHCATLACSSRLVRLSTVS